MSFNVTLRRVVLIRTDASEERVAFIFRTTIIGELVATLAVFLHRLSRLVFTDNVPSSLILAILIMEAMISSETSIFRRAVQHSVP
jgi:hypothetical protein